MALPVELRAAPVALPVVLVPLAVPVAGDLEPEQEILAKKTSYIISESMKRSDSSAFKPFGGSL